MQSQENLPQGKHGINGWCMLWFAAATGLFFYLLWKAWGWLLRPGDLAVPLSAAVGACVFGYLVQARLVRSRFIVMGAVFLSMTGYFCWWLEEWGVLLGPLHYAIRGDLGVFILVFPPTLACVCAHAIRPNVVTACVTTIGTLLWFGFGVVGIIPFS